MLKTPMAPSSSPFHAGEIYVQKQAGTRGTAEELGTFLRHSLNLDSGIATWLSSLRIAWLATVTPANVKHFDNDNSPDDHRSRVWVSAIFGLPRFVLVQDTKFLQITIPDPALRHDIMYSNISTPSDAPIAFLALDLQGRRRYRANGTVCSSPSSPSKIIIRVEEAFPNCPKYIQKRVLTDDAARLDEAQPPVSPSIHQTTTLSADDIHLIERADTFFLGTYNSSTGLDVNHRGGLPGFVRVLDQKSILWPDYRGNGMFQSFGNLHLNDRAGVTFFDFETASLLQLTGRAKINWNPHPDTGLESAAERSVRFDIDAVRRSEGPVTALRWRLLQTSPYNPEIPSRDASRSKDPYAYPMTVKLVKIVQESDDVKTFRFIAPTFLKFLPGQYATFEFDELDGVSKGDLPAVRTWTLSERANSEKGDLSLEISVKRKPGGLISNWLHENAALGMRVSLRGIGGEMTPFGTPGACPSKLLMVSAGIGITPNMAIIRAFGAITDELEVAPDIVVFHQERRFGSIPFRGELMRRYRTSNGKLGLKVCLSGGVWDGDIDNEFYSSGVVKLGRITIEDIQSSVIDLQSRTVYLCGPVGFMENITRNLVQVGVPPDNIVTEKFDF